MPGFLAKHPRINIDLQEKPNAQIPHGVLDGRADIGIVAGRIDTLGLEAIHFSSDLLVLVTSRKHRFARRRRIAFAETPDEDAVGMQQGSTLQVFLALIEHSDPWCVRERYLLVRDRAALPAYAQALVDTLCEHYAVQEARAA